MKNILYIPLDERPCNYRFMPLIAEGTDYHVLIPPEEYLGHKKNPADTAALWDWIFQNAASADGAILSIDMLVYGGIVPSRLHRLSIDQCVRSLDNIKKLKARNSHLTIYANSLIMRCPAYSSNDEEPDYYQDWGKDIFDWGVIRQKSDLNLSSPEEAAQLREIIGRLPDEVMRDYTERRKINRSVNQRVIDLVRDGVIDFLVIPQDDSAPFGFTAMDQQFLRGYILQNHLGLKVFMYPGADEVGMTLFARMIYRGAKSKLNVYVRFASVSSPFIIPRYEDRLLYESIKSQLLCAGGFICQSLEDADLVLMVNAPAAKMLEAWEQDHIGADYNVNRNLMEFIEYSEYIVNTRKIPCAIADVAFSNGGDLELVEYLRQKKLLFKLAAYAGWNTSSNTLGTAITQAFIYHRYGASQSHLNFLGLRYAEDVAYCSHVRKNVTDHLPAGTDLSYFKIDGPRGTVAETVKNELQQFLENLIDDDDYRVRIKDIYMPWSRMFEVGLDVKLESNDRQ